MKGKSILKRILSFALSAAMAVTCMPAQMAQAAEGDAPSVWPERLAYFSFNESLTEDAMEFLGGLEDFDFGDI